MPSDNHSSQAAVAAGLNESQQRAILFSLLDVHRRLAEMEALIVQAQDSSPLTRYVNDLSPIEIKVLRDYFARLRQRLAGHLSDAGIAADVRRGSLRWALQVNLTALHVAVSEISPGRLAGYGPLADAGRASAVAIREGIEGFVDRIDTYLRQGLGGDLS